MSAPRLYGNPLARHYVMSLGMEGKDRWLLDAEWHAEVYLAAIIVRGLCILCGAWGFAP